MKILLSIGVGVLGCAAFLCGFSLVGMWLNGKAFVDGFTSAFDWIMAVIFGGSLAFSFWKKYDDKKDKDKEK